MPKHIEKRWPKMVGIRSLAWGDSQEKWWKAFQKWNGPNGYRTVTDFCREAIDAKADKILAEKGGK